MTIHATRQYFAERMTAATYRKRYTDDALITDAKAQAAQIIADAEEAVRSMGPARFDVADLEALPEPQRTEIAAYVAAAKEVAAAEEVRKLGALTALMQEEFNAIEGWLPKAVMTAVEKIVGSMKADQRMRRIIKAALVDLTDRTALTLKVAPGDLEAVAAFVADAEELAGAFRDVTADPALAPGALVIVGPGGRRDISLDVQLEALQAALLKTEAPSDA